MLNLSVIIKNLRQEKKLTQSELAEILGVTQQAVANYELGVRSRVSPALALQIEQATGGQVTRDELLFPELYQEQAAEHQDQNAA